MAYDGLIFDCDGVLAHPTDPTVLEDAIRRAFRSVGVPDPEPAHVRSLVEPTVASLDTVHTAYGVDRSTFWTQREQEAVRNQRREIDTGRKRPFSDVHVVDGLPLPIGVVSNNQHETVSHFLDHTGLRRHVDTAIGRELDIRALERIKPAPFYLERAIDDLGCDSPLMIGDSPADITAAHRAGIDSLYLDRDGTTGPPPSPAPTYRGHSLLALETLVG